MAASLGLRFHNDGSFLQCAPLPRSADVFKFGTVSLCMGRIRDCTLADLSEVVSIERQSFDHPYSLAVFKKYLRATFLVAEQEQRIVGYIIGIKMGDKTLIVSLAVHPRYRRRGVGTSLVQHLQERLPSSVTEIQVRPSNEGALSFYSALGFERKRVIPRYYANGEDAIVMVRRRGRE